jgi:NDP-sugar pyrophosphorylase family protein
LVGKFKTALAEKPVTPEIAAARRFVEGYVAKTVWLDVSTPDELIRWRCT